MSSRDLVFRVKNYKQPNAEVILNPEGNSLLVRMNKLRATKGNVDPFDYCNSAEIAFIHAINSAYMALGAAAEGKEKIDSGADVQRPELSIVPEVEE